MATTPAKPRFVRVRPTGRVLCDDCIREIRARGVAAAPYPNAVRYRCVLSSGEVLRLCQAHSWERMS